MKRYLLILFFLIPVSQAAILHGTIYDLSLDRVSNAIVLLNSTQAQRYVAHNGTYRFEVAAGTYTISAYAESQNSVLTTKEIITVPEEGEYVYDLFLYPSLEEEENLYEDLEFEAREPQYGNRSLLWLMIPVVVAILLITYITMQKEDMDKDLKKILKLLDKNGGRMSQKDLRKKMAHSEAKVSLMLTELEDMGKIKKIKQGRGNIIKKL